MTKKTESKMTSEKIAEFRMIQDNYFLVNNFTSGEIISLMATQLVMALIRVEASTEDVSDLCKNIDEQFKISKEKFEKLKNEQKL